MHGNYKALGYLQLAKKTFIAGIVGSFIFMVAFIFTPVDTMKRFTPFLTFLILTQCIVVGGYIRGEHYKSFYNTNYLKKALIFLPILALMILTIPFYLSETLLAFIPRFYYKLIPAFCIQSLVQLQQDEQVKILIEKGIRKGSIGRLFGIIFLALLVQCGPLVFDLLLLGYSGEIRRYLMYLL